MQIAFGTLNWTPQVFWQSSVVEFMAALDGWAERHGVKEQKTRFNRKRLEELMLQFPDTPKAAPNG